MKQEILKIIGEWMTDETAQIGPERLLVGNNFDMLAERMIDSISAAIPEDAETNVDMNPNEWNVRTGYNMALHNVRVMLSGAKKDKS